MQKCPDLETQLRLTRVDVAADWLGLDFKKIFLDSLSAESKENIASFAGLSFRMCLRPTARSFTHCRPCISLMTGLDIPDTRMAKHLGSFMFTTPLKNR